MALTIVTHDDATRKDEYETLPTAAELDAMYRYHVEQGNIEPAWTFTHMNGQQLVEADGTIIGRIKKRWCEVNMLYRFSHSECPEVESGIMKGTLKYWDNVEGAAWDLYERYQARIAKHELIQLNDGSYVNADPDNAGFLNWILDRNQGGY